MWLSTIDGALHKRKVIIQEHHICASSHLTKTPTENTRGSKRVPRWLCYEYIQIEGLILPDTLYMTLVIACLHAMAEGRYQLSRILEVKHCSGWLIESNLTSTEGRICRGLSEIWCYSSLQNTAPKSIRTYVTGAGWTCTREIIWFEVESCSWFAKKRTSRQASNDPTEKPTQG